MEFHERLKNIRLDRGIKQNNVAESIGIKNNTLSSYENGKRQPDLETLKKLASFYQVTVDYLLGNDELNENNHESLFFFDKEGLTEQELADIKEHIEYVKWKSQQKEKWND